MAVPRAFARLPADRPAYPGRHTERLLSARRTDSASAAARHGGRRQSQHHALAAREDEGLLGSRGTVGRFVTSDEAALERARRTARQDALEKLAEEAQAAGLTLDDLVQYIREEAQSAAIPSDDPDPQV